MVPIWFFEFLAKSISEGIIIRIWITGVFVFSCLAPTKIAVSVEIPCSCKGKCGLDFWSVSGNVFFNDVLSDLDFLLTGVLLEKLVGPLEFKRI